MPAFVASLYCAFIYHPLSGFRRHTKGCDRACGIKGA